MSIDTTDELLRIENLSKTFSIGGGLFKPRLKLKALQDISFSIQRGETLGIVGESGCGKSTLGRCILQLLRPDGGRVLWMGKNLLDLDAESMRKKRRELQIIFQDPQASLNPRMTVGDIIADPLKTLLPELNAAQRRERVMKMMESVGLQPEMINRYPHEFSGGQAQRIGIARALITEPKLIVCDEPVSALDVSIQAQVINLMQDLQDEFGLSFLFIAHDLSVVEHISSRIAVMYLGHMVEYGSGEQVYFNPKHPYSRALLSAVPVADPENSRAARVVLTGDVPTPLAKPSGCPFRTRCPIARPDCANAFPPYEEKEPEHWVACPYVE